MTQNDKIESKLRHLLESFVNTYSKRSKNNGTTYKHWIGDLSQVGLEIPYLVYTSGLFTTVYKDKFKSSIVSMPICVNNIITQAASYKTAYINTFNSYNYLQKCKVKDIVFYTGQGIILDSNKECLMFTTIVINKTIDVLEIDTINIYINPKVFLEKTELNKLIKDTIFPILLNIKSNPNSWTCNNINIIINKENILENLNLNSDPLNINENRYDKVSKYSNMLINTIFDYTPEVEITRGEEGFFVNNPTNDASVDISDTSEPI